MASILQILTCDENDFVLNLISPGWRATLDIKVFFFAKKVVDNQTSVNHHYPLS